MQIPATPVTSAASGVFSALAWPFVVPTLSDPNPSSTLWLVVGTLLLIALPAHLFVIGTEPGKSFADRTQSPDFQRRLLSWLAAAAVTTGLLALYQ